LSRRGTGRWAGPTLAAASVIESAGDCRGDLLCSTHPALLRSSGYCWLFRRPSGYRARQPASPFGGPSRLPLVGPRGQHGYVAFDSAHLMLYGAIVQQMAAALNSAQLYREATEGRRLAEEANQMKSRFLSTVSHELRTPLNLIVGTSGILLQESDERDTPLPDQMQRDIARIYGSAQHLTGLIGDVLDLASSDAGELRLVEETVDLSQVLRMVEETGRRLAAE
ncbi:MAG: hypothetical protein KDI07_25115, partial [Anaerolineae bacterium]|nr:hypothetical protein [Anaerolineae bacterium]